jgi:hypothetical protein
LPFGIVAVLGLIGLILLIRMALETRPAKSARPSIAAAQGPLSPARVAPAAWTPAEVPVVAHLDATQTTEAVLSSQGPDCLPCAKRNGCLDSAQQGGSCDEVAGNAPACGAGVTERDICYKTLFDVFTSKCAETLQETPCLCGDTDVIECLNGTATPTGPVYRDYACDFKTADTTVIYRDFREPSYGVGRANSLIQCLGGYGCGCFGN